MRFSNNIGNSSWKAVEQTQEHVKRCEDCAPIPPVVKFVQSERQFREDPREASLYEQRLKQRPDALIMKLYARHCIIWCQSDLCGIA